MISFLQKIRNRAADVKTIAALCKSAEAYALQTGEDMPGVEHFFLAAFDLNDGSARRILAQFDVDQSQILDAIEQQHQQALVDLGFEAEALVTDNTAIQTRHRFYHAQPTGQELIRILHDTNKARSTQLVGAHVLEAALSFEYGVMARTLAALKIDRRQLQKAIEGELLTWQVVDGESA